MIDVAECSRLDQLIRQGAVAEARKTLQKVNLKKVPREISVKVAELCRRAGLFHHSVRLLNRVVRPESLNSQPADDGELSEYAMALIKVGAVGEGRQLLSSIDPEQIPQAQLYYALSFFPEWDYSQAIGPLEKFLRLSGIESYQEMIARVNLVAAYLGVAAFEKAEELIREGLEATAAEKLHLLQANFLELSAQLALKQKRYDDSLASLEKANATLKQSGLYDELFVAKWRAVVDCYRSPGSAEALEHLREIRVRACAFKHWETVRNLDLHLASIQSDQRLYHHLYHGTPYVSFRKALCEEFMAFGEPPVQFDWRLGGEGSPSRLLDVCTGQVDGSSTGITAARSLHALLLALTSDFYRPVRVATLASLLFPDEHYQPETMPNRIHQLIRRLRGWSQSLGLGIEIEETDGCYSVAASKPLVILTNRHQEVSESDAFKYSKQLSEIGNSLGDLFTSKEAADRLECSLSTVTRILNAASDAGLVEKIGTTAKRRYRFLARKSA